MEIIMNVIVEGPSGLTPYQFEGNSIRIVERDGEFWFVATDVARELGYAEAKDLSRTLDEDEKGRHSLPTLGGVQEITIISEPGLYRAIIQRRTNKKHDAPLTERIGRFQRWVFHDVLPSIRRTGGYGAAARIDVRDPSQLTTIALQLIEVNRELEARTHIAEAAVAAVKPKTLFYDRFADAEGLYSLQNAARVLGQGPNRFIGWLKQGYLFYQGTALVPKARYRDMGIFEVKATIVDDHARHQTFVTPKGIQYFSKKFGLDRLPLEGAA
jgi:prophage antirepressor-like protein